MKTKNAAVCLAACSLLAPAAAEAHTTISALAPQGPLLTAARTTYAVRAPNETTSQRTWKVVMYVPKPVQSAISLRTMPDWITRIQTVNTDQRDEEGNPVKAITRVSWTAKTRGDEIPPKFYGEWPVRFQNPAFATRLCFGFSQFYTNKKTGKRGNAEIVHWTGRADSEHPSSCLNIVNP